MLNGFALTFNSYIEVPLRAHALIAVYIYIILPQKPRSFVVVNIQNKSVSSFFEFVMYCSYRVEYLSMLTKQMIASKQTYLRVKGGKLERT